MYSDNDYKHLLKYGRVDRFAAKAYQNLQDQIIDKFGIGDDYENQLRMQIQIALMEIDIAVTGDRINQIFIDRMKQQLEEIRSKQKGVKSNPYESLFQIEQAVGYKLDIHKVSVFEFFNYSEQIKNIK